MEPFTSAHTFRFAINTAGRDKDWNPEALTSQFKDKEGTLDDVTQHIKQGHALCCGLLGGKRRAKANVIGSQWLLLDVDNSIELKDERGKSVKGDNGKVVKVYKHELTLDEAIAHPFIRQHCCLIYTTASHKPAWPKFRLIFLLPDYLEGAEQVEAAIKLLMEKLPHDPCCKDAGRVFFGSTVAEFPLVNPSAVLPSDWTQQAISLAEKIKVERQRQAEVSALKSRQYQEGPAEEQITPAALLNEIDPDSSYQIWRDCLLASHHEGIPEAQVRVWSSGSAKHSDRAFDQVWKNIKGNAGGVTAGTLWHYAVEQGWKPPERKSNHGEPDKVAYQEYRQLEDERARVEAVEVEQSKLDKLQQWAARLKAGMRFGKKAPRKAPEVKQIRYRPGYLPYRDEFEHPPQVVYKGEQLFELLVEARGKGWRDILDSSAAGAGKSHNYASLPAKVLLKMTAKETLEAEGTDAEEKIKNRFWLLSTSHRNPTVLPSERDHVDLPTRHNGLIKDSDRKTPLGKDFQRCPKPGEKSEDAGNCHLTPLFHRAAAKGIAAASIPGSANPICTLCSSNDYCGQQQGPGYGFRAQRGDVFKFNQRVRAHMDSLPSAEEYAFKDDIAVLDEALQLMQPVKAIAVGLTDFDSGWATLEGKLPEVYDLLTPLRRALRPLVAGEVGEYHGLDDAAIMERLPASPEGFSHLLEQIRAALEVKLNNSVDEPDSAPTAQESKEITALQAKINRRENRVEKLKAELKELAKLKVDIEPDQGDFFKQVSQRFTETAAERKQKKEEARKRVGQIPKLTDKLAVLKAELPELRETLEKLLRERKTVEGYNRQVRRESKNKLETLIDNLPTQWLTPFLEVWSQEKPGALRVKPFGGLSVTVEANRHKEILDNLNLRVYLDATCTPEMLSLYRGLPEADILNVKMDSPQPENLDFVQVVGLGLASKGRTETCDARIAALLSELRSQHPDLVTFDWLSKRETTEANGHWFSDFTRGTNEFSDRSAIAAVGLPTPNLGAYYDLHLTLTRASDYKHISFDDFYTGLIDAEVVQAVGRLRANRRPDEKLTFYLLADKEKAKTGGWQPPAELKARVVQAKDITIAAGTPSEKAWAAITEVLKRWWDEHGELPNQALVEAETQLTQGYISKLAQRFAGGWKRLKKIFLTLLVSTFRTWNKNSPPSESEVWVAQDYLPEVLKQTSQDVAASLNDVIESFGWAGWRRILSKVGNTLRYQLVWGLLKNVFSSSGGEV